MRVKTQAININEETYPIAVACLPGAFAEIPFANLTDSWLIINMFTSWGRDEYSTPIARLSNGWVTANEFATKYNVVNRKPGVLARDTWYEVELALDEDLAKQLSGEEDESGPFTQRKIRPRMRRHVPGYVG